MSEEIYTLLNKDEKISLDNILKNYDSKFELEASFKKINFPAYNSLLTKLINYYPSKNITSNMRLDITFSDDIKRYRWTLDNEDEINNFISTSTRDSNDSLLKKLKNNVMTVKDKSKESRVNFDDLNFLIKMLPESETKDTKNIQFKNKVFRLKDELKINHESYEIQIARVKQSFSLQTLLKEKEMFEVEIELKNKKGIKLFLEEIYRILQFIQNSMLPITNTESNLVINHYWELLKMKSKHSLFARQAISLEIQHLKFLPHKYVCTDKANGERHQLIIYNKYAYLLDKNLHVKKLDIQIKKDINIILDGELVQLEGKETYLIFDIICYNDISYINEGDIRVRDKALIEIVKLFDDKFDYESYLSKHNEYDLKEITKFYTKQIEEYWKDFNKNKSKFIIKKKLYLYPLGIDNVEVYNNLMIIWNNYHNKELAPYMLDGIILTPISKSYYISISNYDTEPIEYKWKPPKENSIDFYVQFEKENNEIKQYFDSNKKQYYLCNLMVGEINNKYERPIFFKINNKNATAKLYLDNGIPKDLDGMPIEDNTVVEFIYDNEFIPLKTRYDKTEQTINNKKNYGNNSIIASRVWNSIIYPITEDNLIKLSNKSTYEQELKTLENINKKQIIYYQKRTNIGKPMRSFHNFIKSTLISRYGKNAKNILDISCGRGGDLQKLFALNPNLYVGTDRDYAGLFTIDDCASSRIQNIRNKPKEIKLIQADSTFLMTVDSQKKVIPNALDSIDKYLTGKIKYDFINCQFAIHYFLKDDLSWENFLTNIKTNIAKNGHIVITTFDAYLVENFLNKKESNSVYYTEPNGDKKKFFEIKRIDNAIDVYNSMISDEEGFFIREYLVYPDYLIKSFKAIGLELVESALFSEIYYAHVPYFLNLNLQNKTEVSTTRLGLYPLDTIKDVPVINNQKVFNEVKEFYLGMTNNLQNDYQNLEIQASSKFSFMSRYYIFKCIK